MFYRGTVVNRTSVSTLNGGSQYNMGSASQYDLNGNAMKKSSNQIVSQVRLSSIFILYLFIYFSLHYYLFDVLNHVYVHSQTVRQRLKLFQQHLYCTFDFLTHSYSCVSYAECRAQHLFLL